MNIPEIELACDHHEGPEFCQWLNAAGYNATIGNTTGNFVDGVWTGSDSEASEFLRNLWDQYCIEG